MTAVRESGTILDRIVARTRIDVEERKRQVSRADLERRVEDMPAPVSLKNGLARPGTSVIAEFKRASPSRGRFAVEMTPSGVAAEYVAGGAIGMSVLTDEPFFLGSLADLSEAATVAHRAEPAVAILRKDFIVDEYQILEARAAGADAVLLIVAVLEREALKALHDIASEFGLDVLTEVHTSAELDVAAGIGAQIVGVNNRDLHTFTVDLAVTENLARSKPEGALLVSESGIFTRADVERLEAVGADGILVGESIVLSADRAQAIRDLRGVPA